MAKSKGQKFTVQVSFVVPAGATITMKDAEHAVQDALIAHVQKTSADVALGRILTGSISTRIVSRTTIYEGMASALFAGQKTP